MKFLRLKIAYSLLGLSFCCGALAGPYTATKDKACPELWEATTKVVPVVWPNTQAYAPPPNTEGEDQILAGKAADEQAARTHIASRNVINTLSDTLVVSGGHVITSPSPGDDLLSIASECLVYRNLEVDSNAPGSAADGPTNTENGWIPAVVF